VIMPVMAFERGFLKELKGKIMDRFSKMNAQYNKAKVTVRSEVAFGSPARMIGETIRKRKIDLVVMGTHGTSGIREYVVGSNAEKIVRQSPVPVLAIKEYPRNGIKNIVFPNDLDTEKQ